MKLYKEWFNNHSTKHTQLIKKLSHLSDQEIIEYFDFDNMVQNEPDFCPLYKDNQKCHAIEKLNCYLCACPLFRVDKEKSYCSIDAKEGSSIQAPDGYIHQDCTHCAIPHTHHFVQKYFHKTWSHIMKKSFL